MQRFLNFLTNSRTLSVLGVIVLTIFLLLIAQTLLASLAKPRAGAIYNVTDHEPAPPQDVLLYAAELLGVEPPPEVPFEKAQMSEMARSFYADNKRVSNRLIREELGVKMLFPTYREGIRALAAAGEGC